MSDVEPNEAPFMSREQAEHLLTKRAEARAARDFFLADEIRDRIAALGYDVRDLPDGSVLEERTPQQAQATMPEIALDASVHLLYEGFRADLQRFLDGLPRSTAAFEVVIVDNASEDGEWIDSLVGDGIRAIHLDVALGWAQARNAALDTSRGRVLMVADLSIEPTGDIVAPLVAALEDPQVGLAGPWGLTTADLRNFEGSEGPQVHALEGYLMAFRSETFARARFDPWFAWYRHADLDLSFRIRALGLRALVVPVEAVRHEHRGWSAVPEPERSKRSKRNFYRFLDHWKDRTDLIRVPG